MPTPLTSSPLSLLHTIPTQRFAGGVGALRCDPSGGGQFWGLFLKGLEYVCGTGWGDLRGKFGGVDSRNGPNQKQTLLSRLRSLPHGIGVIGVGGLHQVRDAREGGWSMASSPGVAPDYKRAISGGDEAASPPGGHVAASKTIEVRGAQRMGKPHHGGHTPRAIASHDWRHRTQQGAHEVAHHTLGLHSILPLNCGVGTGQVAWHPLLLALRGRHLWMALGASPIGGRERVRICRSYGVLKGGMRERQTGARRSRARCGSAVSCRVGDNGMALGLCGGAERTYVRLTVGGVPWGVASELESGLTAVLCRRRIIPWDVGDRVSRNKSDSVRKWSNYGGE
ncbi:hypothetical protein Tco_0877694 [Tanacetum coccineum]|uniref:Uncharacterized protein n=1 Tax=Tanacetum coccineum TaxID=301880 RepID=A0ABQ5BZ02_9ASTR